MVWIARINARHTLRGARKRTQTSITARRVYTAAAGRRSNGRSSRWSRRMGRGVSSGDISGEMFHLRPGASHCEPWTTHQNQQKQT